MGKTQITKYKLQDEAGMAAVPGLGQLGGKRDHPLED
jgi:hypothetical protein